MSGVCSCGDRRSAGPDVPQTAGRGLVPSYDDRGAGRYAPSAELCRRLVALDPCRESAHRRTMRCLSRICQPHLAILQFRACVRACRPNSGCRRSARRGTARTNARGPAGVSGRCARSTRTGRPVKRWHGGPSSAVRKNGCRGRRRPAAAPRPAFQEREHARTARYEQCRPRPRHPRHPGDGQRRHPVRPGPHRVPADHGRRDVRGPRSGASDAARQAVQGDYAFASLSGTADVTRCVDGRLVTLPAPAKTVYSVPTRTSSSWRTR
ncbi:bacterial transcriptional activator domain-containing protein [Streptomyces sp. NPDC001070]